jgi:hypothetical protein
VSAISRCDGRAGNSGTTVNSLAFVPDRIQPLEKRSRPQRPRLIETRLTVYVNPAYGRRQVRLMYEFVAWRRRDDRIHHSTSHRVRIVRCGAVQCAVAIVPSSIDRTPTKHLNRTARAE